MSLYKKGQVYTESKTVTLPTGLLGLEFVKVSGEEMIAREKKKMKEARDRIKAQKKKEQEEKKRIKEEKEYVYVLKSDYGWNDRFDVSGKTKTISVARNLKELRIKGDWYQVGALKSLCPGTSNRSVLQGEICGVTIDDLHIGDLQAEKMLFGKSTLNECWIDGVVFNRCTFKDTVMNIDTFRWVKFKNCSFTDVKFNCKYVRATSFLKGCTFKRASFDIHQVDEYFVINGERYGESYCLEKIRI